MATAFFTGGAPMGYIKVNEAAERLGMSPRRIQQLCKEGKIKGVIRKGNRLLIPDSVLGNRMSSAQPKARRSLPIGISDFRNAVTNYCYVDKTLLIRDFLDRNGNNGINRLPRIGSPMTAKIQY